MSKQVLVTNKSIQTFITATIILLSALTHAKVQNSDYEELTYDDLVTQLSQKQDQTLAKKNSRGMNTTYLGLGMISSFNQFQAKSNNYNINLNGYEISTATNLKNDLWRAEAIFRLFPQTESGSSTSSLKEIGGNLQYRRDLNTTWRSKFFGGMSFRFLDFTDSSRSVDVQETSSMLLGGAGLEAKLSSNVALGADSSLRFPFFGSSTPDKTSISFAFKLETSFE